MMDRSLAGKMPALRKSINLHKWDAPQATFNQFKNLIHIHFIFSLFKIWIGSSVRVSIRGLGCRQLARQSSICPTTAKAGALIPLLIFGLSLK
jgi:hypothetical protein